MTTLKLKKGCRAIKNFVGLKTAFIEVVIGPPVERQIALTDDTLVVPLGPLGNKHHVEWGIRYTIGYFIDFDIPRFTILPAEDFEFDHIELAGRIRHKIFHGGGALTRADVTKALEPGLQLLTRRPDMIAHWLRRDCELEIVRWARRESRAWLAQNGTTYELPARNPNYDGKSLNKPLISSSTVANSSIGSVFVKVEGADIGVVRLSLGS